MFMKKIITVLCTMLCMMNLTIQAEIICYPETQASINDFWIDHFYYAKCTDYVGTGSKSFEDSEYVDFNGGSSVDFTNIHVSADAEYTVRLSYGIGWADAEGAVLTLNVNDEFAHQLTLYTLTSPPPAVYEFDVELYADYDNVIQFRQVKDWPILQGIQLIKKEGNGLSKKNNVTHSISGVNGEIRIDNLSKNALIQIYSVEGQLIYSSKALNSFFCKPLNSGIYMVKINDTVSKVIVK
jgi:hypothetical protein